jgi:hypothetical protein
MGKNLPFKVTASTFGEENAIEIFQLNSLKSRKWVFEYWKNASVNNATNL